MAKGNGKGRTGGAAAAAAGPENWPASNVELRSLAEIKPYPNNPRTHPAEQVAALAADMILDGVTMPILVDEQGVIIAGHGRLLAAQQNEFAEYPVVIARGWSNQKKNAARLKDNQRGLQSGWDNALIVTELQGLKLEGYDMSLLGFPEVQLRGWGVSMGADFGAADPEVVPEPPKKPVVRKGDLWLLGAHRLLCGDATSESDVAMCLGGAKPHLMVTDPPYGVDYDPDWRNRADRPNGKSYGASAVGLVTNDNRADWTEAYKLFAGDVVYAWSPAGSRLLETGASLGAAGFEIRQQIIWVKTRLIIGRGNYHYRHEPCWYAVKKGKTAHWCGARDQDTAWQIPHAKSETGHSTQKPIECMKRPIENNSRAGDAVYDPFAGSGTTIIACEMTSRKALAIEIEESYVQVSIERWQALTGKLATLDDYTLDQVAKARRKGRARNEVGNSGISVPRGHASGNGSKREVRKAGDARQSGKRRKPSGESPAVAGDS